MAARLGLQWYDPKTPVLGGVYTYITLTHFLLLMLATGLAIQVSVSLNEMQEIVQDILMGNGPHQAHTMEKAALDIEREFLRSKRHHFPLTVIAIEPDPQSVNINLTRSMREIQTSMMARFVLSRLVHITSQLVRRTDLIINQPMNANSFVVFSPDITTDQAEMLAGRIIKSIEKQTGVSVHCGIATYPDEGLNYEDLVRIAQERLKPENSHLAEELDALLKGDKK
jgi:GGDEF domain-containing protein